MAKRKQGIEEHLWPRAMLDYQHPKLEPVPPKGERWSHEPKYDGYRMQVHVRGGQATLYTRNGHDWTDKLPVLATLCGELPDCVLDSELCLLREDGYSTFSGLRAAIGRGQDDTLTLMAFDILWKGESDLRPYALERRRLFLRGALEEADHVGAYIRPVVPLEVGEGAPLLAAACELGLEGIVSKRLDSAYKAGRQDSWIKAKCRPSATVVIGGWVSRGGLSFSHVLAGVREKDGRLRYVGSVKGSFRSEPGLAAQLRAMAAEKSPFDIGSPRKDLTIHWVRPELQAEIEIAEFTASGMVRQASFKGLREDV